MISQVFIMVFGAAAIWFVSRKEKWKRWGYIFGVISQPFWFYTAYTNEQWGIFIMTLFYSYSWLQGIWNYWIIGEGKHISEVEIKNIPEPPEEGCDHIWGVKVLRYGASFIRCKKCGVRNYEN